MDTLTTDVEDVRAIPLGRLAARPLPDALRRMLPTARQLPVAAFNSSI